MNRPFDGGRAAGAPIASPVCVRPHRISRREFLTSTGLTGGGLMLAAGLGEGAGLGGRLTAAQEGGAAPHKVYPPSAFIRIGEDEKITIVVGKLEFGQGV
jgi:isoquinoline 1-oxidoreductase subunit beta